MDFLSIYQTQAVAYDRLVSAEDCDHNLLPAIRRIADVEGAWVFEAGSGTGRITRLLSECGAHIVGTDPSAAMLGVARDRLEPPQLSQVCLLQTDGRAVPVKGAWATVAIAGWVYGHFVEWYGDRWQSEIASALRELERTLEQGGTTIIIETLGTGRQEPQAPADGLGRYYRWLEAEQGFTHQWLRTDYLFRSVEEAAQVTGFFFGLDFADRVRHEAWQRVPECTGMWWKQKQ